MILYVTIVLNLILSHFTAHTHGACTTTSTVMRTSVLLNLTSTHDPPYACRGEGITFSCEVMNGISLQWASGPDILRNRPIGFTTGDDEGETRTRDSYQSRLVSVQHHPQNPYLKSVLTYTPPAGSMDSVTVVCGDQLSLYNSAEAECTVSITDAPTVTERALQHHFSNSQENCPNVPVTIEIEEIRGIAQLIYKLNVSSSDGCVLQECPMQLSQGERILNMTLMNGVEYTAMLTVSNDCGSGNTTLSIHPVCEPRATDPLPETPTNDTAVGGPVVGSVVGGAAFGCAVSTTIFAAIVCYWRKKKKEKYQLKALENQRDYQTEKEKMRKVLKEELKEEHKEELRALEVKMKEKCDKDLQEMEAKHGIELQEVQEKMKKIYWRERKRCRNKRHIALQGEVVPEGSPALLSGPRDIASGATGEGIPQRSSALPASHPRTAPREIRHPLHVAVMQGDLDKVRFIVDKKVDINTKDDNEMTPLHVAVDRAYIGIVKYLVGRGADINIQDDNGRTSLHVAVEEGQGWTVKFLIGKGADFNVKDNHGMTPFHVAAERGRCEEILEHLLSKGGDIDIKNDDGRTPLHIAVQEGKQCTVESLVEKFKADINSKDNDGMTPLHVAFEQGDRIIIMKYLIDKGAEINIKDNNGRTPIHIAAKEGHEFSVKTLVKKGADIRIRDNDGRTPWQVADERGHVNITKFLEEGRSPENIADMPRSISMIDGMKVWKEGNIIRMTVCEDNETMYDLQGTFEVVAGKIVSLQLHTSSQDK